MTQFPNLYFDEDVSVILAKTIAARGFEVVTTQEAGRRSQSDEYQLQTAVQHEAVLLTHNRLDFERLFSEWAEVEREHYGMILVKRRRHVSDMATRILKILNKYSAEDLKNRIFYA